jgi:hypothetical protein
MTQYIAIAALLVGSLLTVASYAPQTSAAKNTARGFTQLNSVLAK